MRRRYAASSEASSLYSDSQPVTRASSRTAVVTPSDDIFTGRYRDGLPGTKDFISTDARQYSLAMSKDSVPEQHSGISSKEAFYDHEPHGPYFSLPPDSTSDAPQLMRRKTAKELIGRFESLSTPSESPGPASSIEFPSRPKRTSTKDSDIAEKKLKGRSPIRQSFRNLLSVFSKKARPGRDISEHLAPPGAYDVIDLEASPGPTARSNKPILPRISTNMQSGPNVAACTTPGSLYSGPLLHLCRPISPNGLPVWANCTAVLHPSHILITWVTSRGSPSTSVVSFTQCTDVRSLALTDLNQAERELLPSDADAGDVKVFELLFEGRAREKFAATSVKERAGWVSAIWDAILRTSEGRSYTPSLQNPHSTAMHTPKSVQPSDSQLQQRCSAVSSERSSSAQLSCDLDRALPALPISPVPLVQSPVRYELYDEPVRKATPPASIASRISALSAITPSRSQSPSIRNLDQRSVVKQRLAQIEQISSPSSPIVTPAKSTRSRAILTSSAESPTYRYGRSSIRSSALLRNSTITSVGANSIIDSYADSGHDSPLSAYSGRLTSIPSQRSMEESNTPWVPYRSPTSPQRRELFIDTFSPASTYSIIPTLTIPSAHPPDRLPKAKEHTPKSIPPDASRDIISSSRQSRLVANLEQHARLSGLEDQIASIQTGLRHLPRDLEATLSERPSQAAIIPPQLDADTKRAVENIDGSVKRIEDQGERHAQGLSNIQAKVDAILDLRSQVEATGKGSSSPSVDINVVVGKLEEMRAELKSDLPLLAKQLEELLAGRFPANYENSFSMKDAAPPSPASGCTSPEGGIPEKMSLIQQKLDELLSAQKSVQEAASESSAAEPAETKPMLEEVLTLLKDDQSQRTHQIERQVDSARYLNELNTWLEAFVNHGTSQIETVVAGVQQLCKELGPIQGLQDAVGEDGKPVAHEGGSLLSDIRQLLVENKGHDESTSMLHTSVQGLMTAVQENMRTSTESQQGFTSESIVGIIDRQRQDQERMLKSLAIELSEDIRGERLRFVEAMKEATTINVQIHVEEFKKELTREVLLMTQEVARLHRERQTLEQQIADLFAFYAKQKQNVQGPGQKGRPPAELYLTVPGKSSSSRGGRRPLPNPTPPGSY